MHAFIRDLGTIVVCSAAQMAILRQIMANVEQSTTKLGATR